jgi:hypothetical protein
MSTNRWMAASLIAVTAVLSVCLYAVLAAPVVNAVLAAPVVNENAGVGTPPALALVQLPFSSTRTVE